MKSFLAKITMLLFIFQTTIPIVAFAQETSQLGVVLPPLEYIYQQNAAETLLISQNQQENVKKIVLGLEKDYLYTSLSKDNGKDTTLQASAVNKISIGEMGLDNTKNLELESGNVGQSRQVLDKINKKERKGIQMLIFDQDPINIEGIQQTHVLAVANIQSEDLLITEVYFDGTDEWIEIYNNTNDIFTGELILSGAKTSNISLNNVEIGAEENIIVGDNLDMLSTQSGVFQSGLSLNIYDTREIHIDLMFSGAIIDNFYVETGVVDALNDQKTSFHKYIDTLNIVASETLLNFNITSPYVASPGKVYIENLLVPLPDPELLISEIYYDDDDEWFEITNLTEIMFSGDLIIQRINNLSGNLYLSGVSIGAGASVIFAESYDIFQDTGSVILLQEGFDFTDLEEIYIDLIWSGIVLDAFFVDQTWVEYYDDAATSFEKIGSGDVRTSTVVGLSLDRIYNVQRGYSANPGIYFTTGENLRDVSMPRLDDPVYTGSLPIDCDDRRDTYTAEFSEIYYGSGLYRPFVEVRMLDEIADYYDWVLLSGTALSGQVWYDIINSDIDVEKNKYILLSDTDFWYYEGLESLYNNSLALNSSGRITLYGYDSYTDSLEILDIIYLEGGTTSKSLYYDVRDNECARVFDEVEKFSPGFAMKLLNFFPINDEPKIVYEYISTGGGGGGCSSTPERFNANKILTQDIRISTVKYLPQENGEILHIVKLKNKNNYDISLRDYNLQILVGDQETTSIKGNTLFADTSMSFVGKYYLENKNSCINLMQGEVVVDRYCYRSLSKATEKDIANVQQGLDFRINESTTPPEIESEINTGYIIDSPTPISSLKISILDIDYNPKGVDINNETISLSYNSETKLNLSELKIQTFKDGKPYPPKRLTSEDLYIYQGQTLTVKGNFSFPNSSENGEIMVNLLHQGNIIANYSYDPSPTIPGKYIVKTVYDGDTFSIDFNGQTQSVRLLGIDAPESTSTRYGYVECYGKEAKEYLKGLIDDKQVSITFDSQSNKKDSYGRWLAYVRFDDKKVNEELLNQGFAFELTHNEQKYDEQLSYIALEKNAKQSDIGLWNIDTCDGSRTFGLDSQELVEDTEEQEYFDYQIQISDLNYNPGVGGIESISLELLEGNFINLNNGFYLLINDRKRNLNDYGILKKKDGAKILLGNFRFPNAKASCVKLMWNDVNFDTYCYDPSLQDVVIATGTVIGSGEMEGIDVEGIQEEIPLPRDFDKLKGIITLKIKSLLPNPLGRDTGNEEIKIFFEGDENIFKENKAYLLIGTTKKYFKDENIVSGKDNILQGNYSLTNSATCVSIGIQDTIFDKFCYPQTKEGYEYKFSNGVLEAINTLDLGILKQSKLRSIGDKVCLSYEDTIFTCKKMPYSKLSIQQTNENKLTKNFFNTLNEYLQGDWPTMYYNTDIKKHFYTYYELKNVLKGGTYVMNFNQEQYQTVDFANIYEQKYPQSVSEYSKNYIDLIVPQKIIHKISSMYKEYLIYLDNSSI